MTRYVGEARIILKGDRALAQRHIPYGRKLLGMLQQTSPVDVAVREVTSPDGVHFRVGYFGGVPVIQITAQKSGEGYVFEANRGYVVAPVTSLSYTAYSDNPSVIINPFKDIDGLWSSAFYEPADELAAVQHPSLSYVDGYSTYKNYVGGLSALVDDNALVFATPRTMSWNNKDESLWLYWFGCPHGRSTFSAYAWVFHNGKMVADLNDFTANPTMLMGVSAKRTATGLTVFATIIESVTGEYHIKLCKISLVPIESERVRLVGGETQNLYGYAGEYELAADNPFQILHSEPFTKPFSYFSSMPHNQDASECRGFVGQDSGSTILLKEYVISFADLDDITSYVSSVQSVTQEVKTDIVYGQTYVPGSIVQHVHMLGDPDALTRAPGVYTYTHTTAPYIDMRYSSVNDYTAIPLTYSYRKKTSVLPNKIRCFVDYADNTPVYAYFHVTNEDINISATQDITDSVSPPSGSLVVEVFNTFPVTANSEFNATVSWSQSWINEYTRNTDSRSYGISAPNYDENGIETVDWLNETEHGSIQENRTISGSNTEVAAWQFGYIGSPILEDYGWRSGTAPVRNPYVIDITTNNKSISVAYLNLRTKSVFMEKFDSGSTSVTTIAFDAPIYYGSPQIVSIQQPRVETVETTSYSKTMTLFKHSGALKFQSGWINSSPPTSSSSSTGNPGFGAMGFYRINAFVFYPNTSGAAALAYGGGPTWNDVTPIYRHGNNAGRPNADVDDQSYELPAIFWPGASGYSLRGGQPGYAVGVSTTKNSYAINANYRSGYSGVYSPIVSVSTPNGTFDYMTGAHGSPWFTSPFLISAIAVRKIQL